MQGSHRNAAFPPLSRCGRRKLLLASCAFPPRRDEFVLTRQSWSYPLTSCVSPNGSTLQIHLQSQLQLPEALFPLKQPTAVQAGLPPALPLRKPTVPVPSPWGWQGWGSTSPWQAQVPTLHFCFSLALATWCWLIWDTNTVGTLLTAPPRAHSIAPFIGPDRVLLQQDQGPQAPSPSWPLFCFAWMVLTGHPTSAAAPLIPDPVPQVPPLPAQSLNSKAQSSFLMVGCHALVKLLLSANPHP